VGDSGFPTRFYPRDACESVDAFAVVRFRTGTIYFATKTRK
jgi:hypothetical protein